jgi:DNA-binding CsgD family transcriptional regulator
MERTRREVIRLSHAGLAGRTLLTEALARLRQALPVEAYFAATTDPATVLFTDAVGDGIPQAAAPQFLTNELLDDDVNKFTELARGREVVRGVYAATAGVPTASPRYRDIMAPIGLGDELRAALRVGGACWGGLCLHRERSSSGFSDAEAAFLRSLAPHLAEGLRAAVLLETAEATPALDGPGLLLLADDLTPVALTAAAEHLLDELAERPYQGELPQVVTAVAARLQQLERDADVPADLMPRARVRSRAGRWLVAHASRLADSGAGARGRIAVILEAAQPAEVAPLLLAAYALTPRETELAALVLAGRSTDAIAAALVVSPFTVQQHLKAIFEKLGVRSRRELVARVFAEQYAPRLRQETPVGAEPQGVPL